MLFRSGFNAYGQTNVPAGLSNVVAVAAGGYHSLALKADGTVVGWGANGDGQTSAPGGLVGVVSLAAGEMHSLAITNSAAVTAASVRIDSLKRSGQDVVIRFRTATGQQYSVECSSSPVGGNWSTLTGGAVVGSGQDAMVTDTNAFTRWDSRFYRVKRSL